MFRRKSNKPKTPRQKQASKFTEKMKMLRAIASDKSVEELRNHLENMKSIGEIEDYYDICNTSGSLSYKVELYKHEDEPVCVISTSVNKGDTNAKSAIDRK